MTPTVGPNTPSPNAAGVGLPQASVAPEAFSIFQSPASENRTAKLLRYKYFFWSLVSKEFKVRYTQSVLGLAWMVIEPLLLVMTLTTIFTLIGRQGPGGHPFPLFFYSGLLVWNLFARSFTDGSKSFIRDAGLMQKIPYPREITILKDWIIYFVEYLFANIAFAVVLLVYQVPPNIYWLYLPALVVLQLIFSTGLMFLLGSLNVYIRDVGILTKAVGTIWFWFTPLIFHFPPEGMTRPLYYINPMVGIVTSFRRVILEGLPPDPEHLLCIAIAGPIFFLIGYTVFRKLEKNFADVI